jgi:hypothetical protein
VRSSASTWGPPAPLGSSGECAYECIVGGSTSVDHGQTWTDWPHVRNRYLYDLTVGARNRWGSQPLGLRCR